MYRVQRLYQFPEWQSSIAAEAYISSKQRTKLSSDLYRGGQKSRNQFGLLCTSRVHARCLLPW